jgi:hypothetical protein
VIGGAADDLHSFRAVIDLTNGQALCIGMRINRNQLGDNDTVESGADGLDALDFKTDHGQLVRDLFR